MPAEPTLRVYLAGSTCIERGSVLVPRSSFPGRQGRLVFAVLATRRWEPTPREALADAVWDGSRPPAWDTALRAIVSKLRALLSGVGLEGDPIRADSGCYRLLLPLDAWIDVEAAEDAVDRAEASLRLGDADGCVGWALVAASVGARSFLPGEEGAFVDRWRERLRSVRIRALQARGGALLLRRQFELAARDAETALGLAPFRESCLQLLMRAHVAAGNAAEALRAYERTRRLMADELGVDPSAESRALFAGILAER
jgi:DNA-binding SARP family transcriptional activator